MSKTSKRTTPKKQPIKISGEDGELEPSPSRHCTASATHNKCSQLLGKSSAVTPENQSNGDNALFQKVDEARIASSPTHPQAELTSGKCPRTPQSAFPGLG